MNNMGVRRGVAVGLSLCFLATSCSSGDAPAVGEEAAAVVEAGPDAVSIGGDSDDAQNSAVPEATLEESVPNTDSAPLESDASSESDSAQSAETVPGEPTLTDRERELVEERLDELDNAATDRPSCADSARPTGLTEAGNELFDRSVASDGLVYEIDGLVDPESGGVGGDVQVVVPGSHGVHRFRVFAGVPSLGYDFVVQSASLNGEAVEATRNASIIEVPGSGDGADTVIVRFTYVMRDVVSADPFGALSGETLQPAEVGLLGLTASGAQLGHWFPVWLPPESRADADPQGFGDIGTFPAATICASITVPSAYQLVSGGVPVAAVGDDSTTTWIEAAHGLRDLSLLVGTDLVVTEQLVEGVAVKVWTAADDGETAAAVLREATVSQQALHDAFGPYPWTEVDIVAAPLGSGVGGMEWPGMIWLESGIFGGSIPGLPDLDGLGDVFGGDLGLEAILGESAALQLSSVREWTIAHELGHEWWHALVGNDSIASPAVDEPLAQFAACVAMRSLHPGNWQQICRAQTTDSYASYRGLGIEDAPADQASDQFHSALQYGAVVYGKAPGFYFEAAEVIGFDPLVGLLADFVAEHPFELVSTQALRQHLIDGSGSDGEQIGELWNRWFSGTFGDEDIGVNSGLGGLDGFGLDGLDDFDLDGLGGFAESGELPESIDDLLSDETFRAQLDQLAQDPEIAALMEEMLSDPNAAAMLEGLLGGGS